MSAPNSLLGLWTETLGAHWCDGLSDAISDGLYEVKRFLVRNRKGRRWLVTVVPNVAGAKFADRIRFCPCCGVQVRVLVAPPPIRKDDPPPNVPPKLAEV